MRTDSPAMAKTAVADARVTIRKAFGGDCVPARPRAFRARSRPGPHTAREAHEAIRPTDFSRAPEDLDRRLDRAGAALYGLIWKRALASQMAEARFDRVRVELAGDVEGPAGGLALAAEGVAMAFDGHLRARGPGDGDAGEETGDGSGVRALAALKEGDRVSAAAVRVARHVAEPPPRYTEAGLVRRLDALGIGRPSTWAAILAVLRERGYALVHERRFVPTERGRVVTAFLEGFFGGWVDYGFTAAMEADLDRIAGGSLAWRGMLEDFWGGFHAALEGAGSVAVTGHSGTGVRVSPGSLSFGASDWRTPKSFRVTADGDADAVDEAAVTLSLAATGSAEYAALPASEVAVARPTAPGSRRVRRRRFRARRASRSPMRRCRRGRTRRSTSRSR